MTDKVYRFVELIGTSQESIEKAIDNAIMAAQSHGKLEWFEVVETRGFIDHNKVKYYQVHVKIGYYS
ncbi:protein with a Dodecin-like topology [Legionella moravica]|uniref:Protein with a Dodecin-like topology n=1 Tax=Legionella moravica TaxID=39962 RepID=A0A378K0T9_9GAMM|nr:MULTISPECIES: dodecin [Legionella]KTD30842.1 protein with a Dodecin-like topology [Legionella moravica]RUR15551.1 dodecin domain-containing protein [Legionella sp. km535]STX63332.1 protein with a Dodecin-like topology [Legionella moravica]